MAPPTISPAAIVAHVLLMSRLLLVRQRACKRYRPWSGGPFGARAWWITGKLTHSDSPQPFNHVRLSQSGGADMGLESKYGFPRKQPLFAGRRYWPAVKAWLDKRNGLPTDMAR